MNRERLAKLNVKANVLKAMAHPSRLCIVEELSKRERCVCELTEMIGADMSTVSKHLTVLKHAGIIADEKRGAMVFYRLRVPCLGKLFETVDSVLECSARELAGGIEVNNRRFFNFGVCWRLCQVAIIRKGDLI